MSKHPPVIIIGMHRSGTGMIANMLAQLGLFLGKRKDANQEAWFFCDLNSWLLSQCGGAWDNPEPIRYLLENDHVRALAADYLCYMMQTPRVVGYLGLHDYLRHRSPANLNRPWGWKDPRSTFTLPLWLDMFPDARVIHVYRHGVDVASSLQTRVQERLAGAQSLHNRRKSLLLYWFHPKRGGFADTLRCVSLEGSFSLWEAYLKEARAQVSRLGQRAMELRYEDFVAEPNKGLASLAQFCGLSAADSSVASIAGSARADRAYAYRGSPELQAFAEKMSGQLSRWGY